MANVSRSSLESKYMLENGHLLPARFLIPSQKCPNSRGLRRMQIEGNIPLCLLAAATKVEQAAHLRKYLRQRLIPDSPDLRVTCASTTSELKIALRIHRTTQSPLLNVGSQIKFISKRRARLRVKMPIRISDRFSTKLCIGGVKLVALGTLDVDYTVHDDM